MKRHWPLLALVLAATFAAYWGGIDGPFLFDDNQNLAPINEWLHGRLGWASVVFGNRAGAFGRWVSMASLVLNIEVAGSTARALKLGNLLLHLVNGVVVFALFKSLLRAGALTRDSERFPWAPLVGAAAWLLHPLFVSTVLYVIQRMAMLSALFSLLAMLAYVRGRLALGEQRRHAAVWLLAVAMPACTILAVGAKENGILAPILCAAIEWLVFAPPIHPRSRASRTVVLVGLVLPALVAVSVVLLRPHFLMGGYLDRPFTLPERLLTQSRVLWDYVEAILLPYGPRMGLYHDDFPISHGLLDPATTLLSLLAWIAAVAFAWRMRRRVPGVALGLAIFLIGHSLESSFLPLLNYFEHRNYLPAVGIIWAVLSAACYVAPRVAVHMHQGKKVAGLGVFALLLVLGGATAARAGIWSSKQAIMAQAFRFHPQSRWLRMELAANAMETKPPQPDQAIAYLEPLRNFPDATTRRIAAAALLIVNCSTGRVAPPDLVDATAAGVPEPFEADQVIALEHLSDGIIAKPCQGLSAGDLADRLAAMLDRSRLPRGDRGIWRLRLKVAQLYLAAGKPSAALQQARLSYAGGTADPQVPVFIADLEIRLGNFTEARRMLDAAASTLSADDFAGREVIQTYQRYLQANPHPRQAE